MNVRDSFKTLLAAGALALMAGGANAATLVQAPGKTPCSISDFTTSTACVGAYAGNDSNQDLNGLFGTPSWVEFIKIDVPDGDGDEDGWEGSALTDTSHGVTLSIASGEPATSGTWAVNSWGPFSKVMAVLKGGPSFSAYLLDLSAFGGKWDTSGIEKGNGKPGPDLSHIALYGVKGD